MQEMGLLQASKGAWESAIMQWVRVDGARNLCIYEGGLAGWGVGSHARERRKSMGSCWCEDYEVRKIRRGRSEILSPWSWSWGFKSKDLCGISGFLAAGLVRGERFDGCAITGGRIVAWGGAGADIAL
jgi:hypothetical protein